MNSHPASMGMSRRPELWLVLIATVATLAAVFLGERQGNRDVLRDQRRSVLLAGPGGSKALADALQLLNTDVRIRREALFDWGRDSTHVRDATLVLMDLRATSGASFGLTGAERRAVRNAVAKGGAVVLVGDNGVERCFAYRTRLSVPRWDSEFRTDSDWRPGYGATLERIPIDELAAEGEAEGGDCDALIPQSVDTLLLNEDDDLAAADLRFRGRGSALLIADADLVSNRALKETDAGYIIMPWLIGAIRGHVVFDEYHHGFSNRRSIFRVAWGWVVSSPAGWALLQLVFALLIGLVLGAFRFGPAISVVERRRRSPLEHLRALAVGLERAHGSDKAKQLIVGGLRRRLGRVGSAMRYQDVDVPGWLGALSLAVPTPEARARVGRLGWLLREHGGDSQVLDTAQAVEDVWEVLGRESRPNRL